MRVLVIEDEQRLARNIARMLQEGNAYAVDVSTDGEDGLHQAFSSPYDLILLDLMLPKVDGLTILRKIRQAGRRTPVLVLTARDATEDVIEGLDLGCDDYLTKPFEMGELLARCKALIRRAYDRPTPLLAVGDVEVNTATCAVRLAGQTVPLTAMEYRLLEYLMHRAGEVVSKTDIVEHLYDYDTERFSNVIEVYISMLRKRLGAGYIRTVRGMGYVLEAPAE